MNYMLLVYAQELPEEPQGEVSEKCLAQAARLDLAGILVAGGVLHSVACATSVRVREGRRIVTDGPFAETREQLAGYMIVDAENLDEALTIAAEHPTAQRGTVEVRPLCFVPKVTRAPLA